MTVYVFSNPNNNIVKIGCTHVPTDLRLEYFKRSKDPIPTNVDKTLLFISLEIQDFGFELEFWLHKELSTFNVVGEWFDVSLDVISNTIARYNGNKSKLWTCIHSNRNLGKCHICRNKISVRMCPICGKIFDITKVGQRKRKFCNDSCRERSVKIRTKVANALKRNSRYFDQIHGR